MSATGGESRKRLQNGPFAGFVPQVFDCPPVQATVRNPITVQMEDIGRSPTYMCLKAFLKELTLNTVMVLLIRNERYDI